MFGLIIICTVLSMTSVSSGDERPKPNKNGVFAGMPKTDFLKIYPRRKARTLREQGNEEWITYNDPLSGKPERTVTFHLKDRKVVKRQVNDRREVVKEYLGEFCSGGIIEGRPPMIEAIVDVLRRIPSDVFLRVTDRRRPVVFVEYYDAGTARFAGSLDFARPPEYPDAFQNGFTLIKLSTGLNTAGSKEAITGIVAHELAHRALDHFRQKKKSCDLEREANQLIIKWGFKKEYLKAREKFGRKRGDSASCEEH